MPEIPRERSLDSTLALLRDPYCFIPRRCARFGTDLFETRILLQKTICMSGSDAAELFYDQSRFQRRGASPPPVQRTLFGVGGVQGLDDEAHLHRKSLFMSIVTPQRVSALTRRTEHWWDAYAHKWQEEQDDVQLYSQTQEILCRAVCEWAGAPIPEAEFGIRKAELTALFDSAGAAGPRHLWSRFSRLHADSWMTDFIRDVRAGRVNPPVESAAMAVAWHRDLRGELLPDDIAAVELLNVLRPVIAVSVYLVFAGMAIHEHAGVREKLQSSDADYAEWFAEEVRRHYPFFPALTAIVRRDFEWRGYRFTRGARVLMDVYGTNHDPRGWDAPEQFRPERFADQRATPFNFIPQGGGDAETNHRCPGERIAVEQIKLAASFLGARLAYEVPPQDLRIDSARLPALPLSRLLIRHVRRR